MITCDRPRATLGAVLSAGVLLLIAPPAGAQAQDQATARALFNEARDLMKQDHYDQACPKLEAASKLFPGSGVLLNLGDCYEHIGRTASAWTEFGEAASAAERAGRPEDQAEALRRQSVLEPQLARLAIRVTKDTPGLLVSRDGTLLDRGAWGTAIPIDPGSHTVAAEAPGHARWTKSVDANEKGKTLTVEVPELQAAEGQPATAAGPAASPAQGTPNGPAQPVASSPSYWSGGRIAGVTLTVTGVVAAGVGGLVGLAAKSKYNTAVGETGAARHDDSSSAVSMGNVASVVVGVGAAVAVGGLVLWLASPGSSAQGGTQVGTNGSEVLVRGSF